VKKALGGARSPQLIADSQEPEKLWGKVGRTKVEGQGRRSGCVRERVARAQTEGPGGPAPRSRLAARQIHTHKEVEGEETRGQTDKP
jgi:hypothetical protein